MEVKRRKVEAVFDAPAPPSTMPPMSTPPAPAIQSIQNVSSEPPLVAEMPGERWKTILPLCLAIVGVLIVVIAVVRSLWNAPVVSFDEGILLTFSDLWTRGKVPNRDFFSNYPPGNYWIIGTAFNLLGHSIDIERTVGLLYRLLLTAAVFLIARPRGNFLAMVATILAFLASTEGGLCAFAWIGAMAFCLTSIVLLAIQRNHRGSRAGLVLAAAAGLFAGMTPLLRCDMPGIGIVIASAALIWQLASREKIAYAIAWFLGVLPLLIHALRTGTARLLDNLYFQMMFRIGPHRKLPIPPVDPYVAKAFDLTCLAIAFVVVGQAFVLWRRRDQQTWIYASLAVLTGCCVPQVLQRADVPHFMYVDLLAFALVPVVCSQLFEGFVASSKSCVLQLASVGVVLCAILYAARCAIPSAEARGDPFAHAVASAQANPIYVSNRGRYLPVHVEQEQQVLTYVLRAAEELTKPGDRLYTGTGDLRYANSNDMFFYFLLPQLEPAGYRIQDDPGYTNADDSTLPQEIATADLLILNTFASSPVIQDNGGMGSDKANRVVFSKFKLQSTIGWYEIYVRKTE